MNDFWKDLLFIVTLAFAGFFLFIGLPVIWQFYQMFFGGTW